MCMMCMERFVEEGDVAMGSVKREHFRRNEWSY